MVDFILALFLLGVEHAWVRLRLHLLLLLLYHFLQLHGVLPSTQLSRLLMPTLAGCRNSILIVVFYNDWGTSPIHLRGRLEPARLCLNRFHDFVPVRTARFGSPTNLYFLRNCFKIVSLEVPFDL